MTKSAVLLEGSIGLGHAMLANACSEVLAEDHWTTRRLDAMALSRGTGLFGTAGLLGKWTFDALIRLPPLYDGLHFSHLRPGTRLAIAMDRAARASIVPALQGELANEPADVIISMFATGAAAAADLRRGANWRSVVLCSDVSVHRLWVHGATDLFLVTSPAAAASVRRYRPRANISIIPPPVREAFFHPPTRRSARDALGLSPDRRCVLLIDSGWGFGALLEGVQRLAAAGVHVLAVAGRNRALERRFRDLEATSDRVTAFGMTNDVPGLMAAADLVICLPGATTCSEARVMKRPLLLLDVMPGHGRDNLLHELEAGAAEVCAAEASSLVESALALLERDVDYRNDDRPTDWRGPFRAALLSVGVDLSGGSSSKEGIGVEAGELEPVLRRDRAAEENRDEAGFAKGVLGASQL